ncbi:hypothetical protein V5P93_000353 [Actinokineospora auranticolor]|uniref:Uncharacterized protein n=1 Tax=Actinokineospora auranticolor TaxID=155976 RepID=A0A2S6GKL9_9PSEU|nr:hypothetical protein [Actinokineospora auranticolor]PPK65759.1 hypothetical protein CLV40_11218 [Actinokineospora auranticolor]
MSTRDNNDKTTRPGVSVEDLDRLMQRAARNGGAIERDGVSIRGAHPGHTATVVIDGDFHA